MNLLSRREKYYTYNSLTSIPMMLVGKGVLIDLRNETSVAGRIDSVDGYMNINLKEVVFIDQKGLQYEFDEFMIPSRTLRQIHIPEMVDVEKELQIYLEKLTKKKSFKKDPKTRSFKGKRAKERHRETVEELKSKEIQ